MPVRNKPLILNVFFTRQRGFAATATILLLVVAGIGALTIYFSAATRARLASDQTTVAALAQARDALIGYAVSVDTSGAPGPRPGELPCPSRTALTDGTPAGIATTPCNGLAIGYLPWRTLGLPELRDGSGELLWYAVSTGFKNNPRVYPLNSDTAGEFTVTGTTAANNVIAIVFAPGAPLDIPGQSQDRTKLQNSICPTTGTTIARVLCAANYLEGGNHDNDTNFVSSLTSNITTASNNNFNDKIMLITREDLFPAVENRVARDIRLTLQSYKTTNNYYPYAAPLNGTACQTGNYPAGLYRGRVPLSCTDLAPLTLPTWFTNNNWNEVLVYAVAPRCTPRVNLSILPILDPLICFPFYIPPLGYLCTTLSNLGCTNGPNNLSLDGDSTVEALIIPAGPRFSTQSSPRNSIVDYLESVNGNNENIDTPDDQQYVKPARSSSNNDSLLKLP